MEPRPRAESTFTTMEQFLNPADWKQFKRGSTTILNYFDTQATALLPHLLSRGADYDIASRLILQTLHTINTSYNNYLFLYAQELFNHLPLENFPPEIWSFLTTSIQANHEVLGYREHYRHRLITTTEHFLHPDQNPGAAVTFHFIKHLANKGTSLALSNHSGIVENRQGYQIYPLQTEKYTLAKDASLVRVENLFVLDKQLKSPLQAITQPYLQNILWMNQLGKTEFGGRLGYYTLNTLASMMQVDFNNTVVLDCGMGSGVLSLAALKLGAVVAIGVEINASQIAKATAHSRLNTYQPHQHFLPLHADLKDTPTLLQALSPHLDKPVIILSNIGHWPDYPIGNLTPIMLIPEIIKAGGTVAAFIGGGYGGKWVRPDQLYPELTANLKEHGINPTFIPEEDCECDEYVFKTLGIYPVFSRHF